MTAPRVEVQPDAAALATAVAGELLSRLADAQAAGHEPQIALTGGTIADAVHRELARLSPGSEVDWGRVVVWWGDERFVARDSADRNATGRPGGVPRRRSARRRCTRCPRPTTPPTWTPPRRRTPRRCARTAPASSTW